MRSVRPALMIRTALTSAGTRRLEGLGEPLPCARLRVVVWCGLVPAPTMSWRCLETDDPTGETTVAAAGASGGFGTFPAEAAAVSAIAAKKSGKVRTVGVRGGASGGHTLHTARSRDIFGKVASCSGPKVRQ